MAAEAPTRFAAAERWQATLLHADWWENEKLLQHGAEIALLRDHYRAKKR